MDISEDCTLVRLSDFKDRPVFFDCNDLDLNDFFHNDALDYESQLLAVTYLFINNNIENEIVAFFSLAKDNLNDQGYGGSAKKKIEKNIHRIKRRRSYPAVKLARLGVSEKYKASGIGSQIMGFIKGWMTYKNKTGCRFLIVDAYNNQRVLNFYENNEMVFLTSKDAGIENTTRSMFYDLSRLIP